MVLSSCARDATPQAQTNSTKPETPTYTDCNMAELVSETIPAGTRYQAGETFEKSWVIRNTSRCTWSNSYSLVYYAGTGMGESTHRKLTEFSPQGRAIKPGESVTLTLNQRAPFAPGRQVGYWKLRNPAGVLFIPTNINQDSLRVDIEVVGTVYSFADNVCDANWSLDGMPIDCPMSGESGSYEFLVDHFPSFENGSVENETAISILLPSREGSMIAATFPAILIQPGDHLHLGTSCAIHIYQCDLDFIVSASTESGSVIIGDWHEIYDRKLHIENLDVSQLAGQSVEWTFTIRSNGDIEGNRGFWFFPVLLPY